MYSKFGPIIFLLWAHAIAIYPNFDSFAINLKNNSKSPRVFELKFLNDNTVKCNDGSAAGPAKNTNSKEWLIFLEGGWYCFDEKTCFSRRINNQALFSSINWDKKRFMGGILSSEEKINPIYHNFHNIYIPYCSSDLWTGKKLTKTEEYYFHGSRIIHSVLNELLKNEDFTKVERLVLAGSSAGGIGVMMNIDLIARRIVNHLKQRVIISGIVDSGWFLDRPPFQKTNCTSIYDCPPEEGIHRGIRLWSPRIPKRCREAQRLDSQWRCYLGPIIRPFIKTPIFIIQSLFDEAQLQLNKAPLMQGGNPEKFSYIQQVGIKVAESLKSFDGVFAPSCVDHEILTTNQWSTISISDQKLVDVLNGWDQKILYDFSTSLIKQNQKNKNNLSSEITDKTEEDSSLIFVSKLAEVLNNPKYHYNNAKWNHLNREKRSSKYQYNLVDNCIDFLKVKTKFRNFYRRSPRFAINECLDKIPLIPFCNPTCLSANNQNSMYRFKLSDLLQLYNLPAISLIKELGIDQNEFKLLPNNDQMKIMFCNTRSNDLRSFFPFRF